MHNCEDGSCSEIDNWHNLHPKKFSDIEGKWRFIPNLPKSPLGFRSINKHYNKTNYRQRFAYLPPHIRPISYVLWMLVLDDEPAIIGNVTIAAKVFM